MAAAQQPAPGAGVPSESPAARAQVAAVAAESAALAGAPLWGADLSGELHLFGQTAKQPTRDFYYHLVLSHNLQTDHLQGRVYSFGRHADEDRPSFSVQGCVCATEAALARHRAARACGPPAAAGPAAAAGKPPPPRAPVVCLLIPNPDTAWLELELKAPTVTLPHLAGSYTNSYSGTGGTFDGEVLVDAPPDAPTFTLDGYWAVGTGRGSRYILRMGSAQDALRGTAYTWGLPMPPPSADGSSFDRIPRSEVRGAWDTSAQILNLELQWSPETKSVAQLAVGAIAADGQLLRGRLFGLERCAQPGVHAYFTRNTAFISRAQIALFLLWQWRLSSPAASGDCRLLSDDLLEGWIPCAAPAAWWFGMARGVGGRPRQPQCRWLSVGTRVCLRAGMYAGAVVRLEQWDHVQGMWRFAGPPELGDGYAHMDMLQQLEPGEDGDAELGQSEKRGGE